MLTSKRKHKIRRNSSAGQSIRFIPEVSQVQVLFPLPIWPGGQAVKTPPFHGGNTGSIPVRVTKIRWCGGIGRHKGLKIPRTNNPYRFKSGHQHQMLGLPCVTSAYRFRHLFRCLFSFVIFSLDYITFILYNNRVYNKCWGKKNRA